MTTSQEKAREAVQSKLRMRYVGALLELGSYLSTNISKKVDEKDYYERYELTPEFFEALRDLEVLILNPLNTTGRFYKRTTGLLKITPEEVIQKMIETGDPKGKRDVDYLPRLKRELDELKNDASERSVAGLNPAAEKPAGIQWATKADNQPAPKPVEQPAGEPKKNKEKLSTAPEGPKISPKAWSNTLTEETISVAPVPTSLAIRWPYTVNISCEKKFSLQYVVDSTDDVSALLDLINILGRQTAA